MLQNRRRDAGATRMHFRAALFNMVELRQIGANGRQVPMIELQSTCRHALYAWQFAEPRGRTLMKRFWSALGLIILSAALAHGATNATISGVVKNPAGAPVRGAFVHAQNLQSKITVNVMSDGQGRYRIPNLAPGEYQVRVTATGFKADPRTGVKLSAGASSSVDFTLQAAPCAGPISLCIKAKTLMPEGKGKDILTGNCFACHGFQTRMAAVRRDHDGWTQVVNYMLTTRHARLGNHFNDEDAAVLTNYLNDAFGAEAKLPKTPADMAGYKATLRPVSDDGLKINYVEYEMPGPNRMPFSATPDKDGKLWIPNMGSVNTLGHLDPATGAIQEFTAPNSFAAGIHSAVPAPDGSVWISEQAANKVGHWDPKTKLITEYQDTYKKGMEGLTKTAARSTPCASIRKGACGERRYSTI